MLSGTQMASGRISAHISTGRCGKEVVGRKGCMIQTEGKMRSGQLRMLIKLPDGFEAPFGNGRIKARVKRPNAQRFLAQAIHLSMQTFVEEPICRRTNSKKRHISLEA